MGDVDREVGGDPGEGMVPRGRGGTMTIVDRLERHFRRKDLREALVEASRDRPTTGEET